MTMQELLHKLRRWESVEGYSEGELNMLRACIQEIESYAESQCESAQEDPINRQAAIDALVAEGRTVDSRYLESERIIHESDAVGAISMLPSVEPGLKWHKFEQIRNPETGLYEFVEPFPKVGQHILVSIALEGHEPVQDDYMVIDGCECYLDSGYNLITDAVAWMPMPEPYKGEK